MFPTNGTTSAGQVVVPTANLAAEMELRGAGALDRELPRDNFSIVKALVAGTRDCRFDSTPCEDGGRLPTPASAGCEARPAVARPDEAGPAFRSGGAGGSPAAPPSLCRALDELGEDP